MSERETGASSNSPEQRYREIRKVRRLRFFVNRYDWLGPLIVALSSWYFAAQVVVAWVFRPHYSFVSNVISDLGNTACHPKSGICSPLWLVMDISIIILGGAMGLGAVLIFSEFSLSEDEHERVAAIVGFWSLGFAGVGAILVGAVPENVNTAHLHTVGTTAVIALGQLAIVILGFALRDIPDWLREFMLVTSLLVLLVGISIAGKHQFGLGAGTAERLAQYPESVWLILFGFYISRDHYRKRMHQEKGFGFSGTNLYTSALRRPRRGMWRSGPTAAPSVP